MKISPRPFLFPVFSLFSGKVSLSFVFRAFFFCFFTFLLAAGFAPSAFAATATLANPIPGVRTFSDFVRIALSVVVKIGIPVATVFIILSGFQFLTAQGDMAKLKKAKDSFVWAVVGTAILLGAWAIATAIGGTIKSLGA